jgi:hypothetical protein
MTKNALKLLKDDKLHSTFKNQAQTQAGIFNIDKVVGKYESIYVNVVESIQY